MLIKNLKTNYRGVLRKYCIINLQLNNGIGVKFDIFSNNGQDFKAKLFYTQQ